MYVYLITFHINFPKRIGSHDTKALQHNVCICTLRTKCRKYTEFQLYISAYA